MNTIDNSLLKTFRFVALILFGIYSIQAKSAAYEDPNILNWKNGESKRYFFNYLAADRGQNSGYMVKYIGEFKIIAKKKSIYIIQFTYIHYKNQDFALPAIANLSNKLHGTSLFYSTDRNGKFIKFLDDKDFNKKFSSVGFSIGLPKEPIEIKGRNITLPKFDFDFKGSFELASFLNREFKSLIKNNLYLFHEFYSHNLKLTEESNEYKIQNFWNGDSLSKKCLTQVQTTPNRVIVNKVANIDEEKAGKELHNYLTNFVKAESYKDVPDYSLKKIEYVDKESYEIDKESRWIKKITIDRLFKTYFETGLLEVSIEPYQ